MIEPAELSTPVLERGKPCVWCGYDLRGTPTDTCPECGGNNDLVFIVAQRRKATRLLLASQALFWFGPLVAVCVGWLGDLMFDRFASYYLLNQAIWLLVFVSPCVTASVAQELARRSRRFSFRPMRSTTFVIQLLVAIPIGYVLLFAYFLCTCVGCRGMKGYDVF